MRSKHSFNNKIIKIHYGEYKENEMQYTLDIDMEIVIRK